MKKTVIGLITVLLLMPVLDVASSHRAVRRSTGSYYQFMLLPVKDWSFGFYKIDIVVDGVHGRDWSRPEGWVLTLGFCKVEKFDDP
jgi:hypothetical protein